MIKNLYCIKDLKVGFMTPSLDDNDESAIRNFAYAMNNNQFMKFSASDFELYNIGAFDTDSGELILTDKKYLANGLDFGGVKDEV